MSVCALGQGVQRQRHSLTQQAREDCFLGIAGSGGSRLPLMEQVKREARRRKVELLILPTLRAIQVLKKDPPVSRNELIYKGILFTATNRAARCFK